MKKVSALLFALGFVCGDALAAQLDKVTVALQHPANGNIIHFGEDISVKMK